jgi:hypothetical protein
MNRTSLPNTHLNILVQPFVSDLSHVAWLFILVLFSAVVGRSQSVIYTVAGSGQENVAGTTANPGFASGIALDAAGNVYLAISDSSVVLQLSASTGKLSVFAGTGAAGYSGDSGLATSAQLNGPSASQSIPREIFTLPTAKTIESVRFPMGSSLP